MDRTDEQRLTVRKVKQRLRRNRWRRSAAVLPVILLAMVVLLAALWVPVLQVRGTSMAPAVSNGETVAVLWQPNYQPGDIVAFECQGQILIRRLIAGPGSLVDIDTEGNVTVDGVLLNEPYVTEKALGVCTTQFPCKVPEGHWFVLSDRRSTSLDSRSTMIGCVSGEDIIGRIFAVLLPWDSSRLVS